MSDNAHAEAGPHHRWATAALWDNITVNGHDLDAQNTCESGTGHGWEGANCVIWNSKASHLKVARPPGARNWLIGSIGAVSKGGDCHGVVSQPGAWDSSGTAATNVFPNSLYFAQLQDRLAVPDLQTRDYWLGEIDGFTNTIPRDVVSLDSAWSNSVESAAGSLPLDPFNVVAAGHWVPFTFSFSLAPSARVVAASLSLAMRSMGGGANDTLYLGSLTNSLAFSNLNWFPIGVGTNTTTKVLDLGSQLDLLAGGKLNAAVRGDVGLDWAMLELQVAPNLTAFTNSLFPEADAFVQGGTSAASNFGAGGVLAVKADASAEYQRRAYLRWNLDSVTGTVYQAVVRLMPVSVGGVGYENGAAPGPNDNWNESSINWNNQPGAGERIATWLAAANAPVQFLVTPQVQDALAGNRRLTLELFSVRNSGGSGIAYYASRENADPNLRPRLILLTSSVPSTANSLGLRDVDIGGVNPPGGSTFAGGVFTLYGGGNDIWGTNDQFHFTYLPITNNNCQVIARVAALQPVNAWTKCGVMIRETLDGASRQAMTVLTPSNGVNFMFRTDAGGASRYAQVKTETAPLYVKLVRTGNDFSSWSSSNGAAWSQIGVTQTIPMSGAAYAGLCLSSHETGTLAAATVDQVSVINTNSPPTLAPIASRTLDVGANFSLTNSAADADGPLQTLTFRLLEAPAGVDLNATNGVMTWLPSAAQGGTSNQVVLSVTDNGSPPLSATQSLALVVNPVPPLRWSQPRYSGTSLCLGDLDVHAPC